jgi:hypothetical protein
MTGRAGGAQLDKTPQAAAALRRPNNRREHEADADFNQPIRCQANRRQPNAEQELQIDIGVAEIPHRTIFAQRVLCPEFVLPQDIVRGLQHERQRQTDQKRGQEAQPEAARMDDEQQPTGRDGIKLEEATHRHTARSQIPAPFDDRGEGNQNQTDDQGVALAVAEMADRGRKHQ